MYLLVVLFYRFKNLIAPLQYLAQSLGGRRPIGNVTLRWLNNNKGKYFCFYVITGVNTSLPPSTLTPYLSHPSLSPPGRGPPDGGNIHAITHEAEADWFMTRPAERRILEILKVMGERGRRRGGWGGSPLSRAVGGAAAPRELHDLQTIRL